MRINRLHIQGYRSLYDVVVEPGDLTVVVGPNNAGKTNLVEAINFLSEVYRHGPELAVNRKGGVDNIFHRRAQRTRRHLAFSVEVQLSANDLDLYSEDRIVPPREEARRQIGELRITHEFSLIPLSRKIGADFEIGSEMFSVGWRDEAQPLMRVVREGGIFEVAFAKQIKRKIAHVRDLFFFSRNSALGEILRKTDLYIGATYNPIERIFVEAMGAIRLFQLAPLESRKPGVPTPHAELGAHGENLPALVDYLRKKEATSWRKVIESMQRVVPNLQDIRTEFTLDRRLALQFVESDVRRPWSTEDVSDGTIQALAFFVSLFDQRASLVLIEEPENSVHPWIVRNFVEACREVRPRQVIVTTHSPVLINHVNPGEVFIASRKNGRTAIESLLKIDPDAEKLWSEGQLSLFELLDGGFISRAVPGERG